MKRRDLTHLQPQDVRPGSKLFSFDWIFALSSATISTKYRRVFMTRPYGRRLQNDAGAS